MGMNRANRVAEEIKREIAQMLREEIKDPRVGFVTLTGVDVTSDLRYAKVFFSVYGSDEEKEQTMAVLQKAQGYIRSELGKRLRLRYTPELSFKFDDSILYGAKIMELLETVKRSDEEGSKHE